ncbi:MAG: hypothetical protein ACK5AO_03005 [bacterium]|jgi:hypothetical protein
MKKMIRIFIVVSMLSVVFISCKKDPVVDPNEEELLTTVRITLTEKISGVQSVFEFKDLDGEGGQPPSKFDQIILAKQKVYDCTLEFLNESANPVDNITAEIQEEGADHEIFFTSTNSLVTFSNLSKDANNLPLGLTSTWTASNATGTGTLSITLKHKPGIKASGDPITKGETDVALDFALAVQ